MPDHSPTALWQAARDAARGRASGMPEPGDLSVRGFDVPEGIVDRGREVVDQVHRRRPAAGADARVQELVRDTSLGAATTGAAVLRRLAGVVLVLGIVGAVAWVSWGMWRLWSDLDAFVRVDGPGETVVELEPGEVTVYDESEGRSFGFPPEVSLRPTEGGPPLRSEPSPDDTTYDLFGFEGRSLASFTVDAPGRYVLDVGDGAGTVALGTDVGSRVRDAFVGGAVILFLGVAVGITLLILAGIVGGAGSDARRRTDDPFLDLPPAGPLITKR